MINTRESEIRDEALKLAVAAYNLVSEMPKTVSVKIKNQLIDDSFKVSSLVAEVFKSNQNDKCEACIVEALNKLSEIKQSVLDVNLVIIKESLAGDRFVHISEERYVELTELLSAIRLLNTESYSPKLEMACF